jgi:hypothetical protein
MTNLPHLRAMFGHAQQHVSTLHTGTYVYDPEHRCYYAELKSAEDGFAWISRLRKVDQTIEEERQFVLLSESLVLPGEVAFLEGQD